MNTQPHNAENGQTLEEAAIHYADSIMQDVRIDNPNRDKIWDCAKADFTCGAYWQQDTLFSIDEVLSMLEALRQRCAEENAHAKRRIELIDLTQFLPPLNK